MLTGKVMATIMSKTPKIIKRQFYSFTQY